MAGLLLMGLGACRSSSSASSSSAQADASLAAWDIAAARNLANGKAPLLARAESVATAEATEARAKNEGASARASELHAIAAAILERVWRTGGDERDGSRALELYEAASRYPKVPGACEAALKGARLARDLARDASAEYAGLYRVERADRQPAPDGDAGAPDASCARDVAAAVAELAPFRPSQDVLDAIDRQLAEEGALAPEWGSPFDAGAPPPDGPPRIVRVDAWPGRDSARVVVQLDRPAGYRAGDDPFAGSRSPRTFLELDGVDLGAAPRDIPETGIVTRVRIDPTSTGSRVSLDLDGRAFRRVFYMQEPYRVIVDIARRAPGSHGRGPRGVERVVLDPGHGGKDTGAVGPTGLMEKDVTLDVARRVGAALIAQGIHVLLTREDDRFVTLEERTARANAFSADLFLSIHCNASEGRARRGVETYLLDAARDEIAARIAARENETTQAASADLASMLGRMRLADQAARSAVFAGLVERAALATLQMKFADVVDGGVHVAGFYVLVGARMPSALLEASYISNAVDEQRLGTPEYRQMIADAMANAVKAYREGR